MSHRRLRQRTPSAEFVAVASLSHHLLRFHKQGRDNSAKCDALFTGQAEDIVVGVVFHIDPTERQHLDRAEGLGAGYETKLVSLLNPKLGPIEAFTYYATSVNESLLPYHWYKEHVLVGCRENNLPSRYVQAINMIESIADPDKKRAAREAALYEV